MHYIVYMTVASSLEYLLYSDRCAICELLKSH